MWKFAKSLIEDVNITPKATETITKSKIKNHFFVNPVSCRTTSCRFSHPVHKFIRRQDGI